MPKTKGAVNKEPPRTIFADSIASKPPQCRVFACVRDKKLGIRQDCCFYCPEKSDCYSPCLNKPDRCGLLVIPRSKESDQNADSDDTESVP